MMQMPKRSLHTFDELLARAVAEEVTIYPLRLNMKVELPTFNWRISDAFRCAKCESVILNRVT